MSFPAIPAGYKYASIAPRSTVDVVVINGAWLGPGTIVPLYGRETAAKGWRAMPDNHVPELCLQLWRDCDHPVPGPRTPFTTQASFAYASGADSTWTKRAVLPMAGRRHARISISAYGDSTAASWDYALVGYMYGTREYAKTHRVGSNGSTLLVPSGNIVTGTDEAYVVYVGGWDSEEAFDELVVYTRKPLTGDVVDASILAECWGDRGAGY